MIRSLRERILTNRWVRGQHGAQSVWDRVVVVCYLVLVVLGVTTSSVAAPGLLDDPSAPAPGLIAGGPDTIRSDEFLRGTPWAVGVLESGGDNFGSVLSYPDAALVATKLGGTFTTILFPEARVGAWLGRWLPAQIFAANWWSGVLVMLLLVPRWFRRLGVDDAVSLPLTGVLVVSPVSVWWTWNPVFIMAAAVLVAVPAATALDALRDRRWPSWQGALLGLVAAIGLGRLALSYQPWAIPLGAAILLPTLAVLLRPRQRRWRVLAAALTICFGGGLLLAGFLAEHRSAVSVLSATVYPGARRFAGALSEPSLLLAGPHLWVSQTSPPLIATNLSEIASGFTVLGVVALLVVPSVRWSSLDGDLRTAATVSSLTLAALGSWCLMAWPTPVSNIFPINLVSPDRLAQVLGLAATLTFGLVLSAWRRGGQGSTRATAAAAGVATLFLTAVGGSAFRAVHLPAYRAVEVMGVSLLAAAAVVVSVSLASRSWGLVPLLLLAGVTTAAVNPWQRGFADLVDGQAAEAIREVASAHPGGRWVSGDIYTDALLMAAGQPALSGQQWVGPDRRRWKVLDPDGGERDLWDRGAAYITFAWGPAGSPPEVTLPSADVVAVTVDPCGPALDRLHASLLVASTRLDARCLDLEATFDLGGTRRWVYFRSS